MSNLDWADDAACRDMDPEIFFGHGDAMTVEETDRAKAICAECPAREACLDYAVRTNQQWGIWGGTTRGARMRLRSKWIRDNRGRVNAEAQERTAEARRLANLGCTSDQIAAQLGVHLRTAQRLSSPARIPVSA